MKFIRDPFSFVTLMLVVVVLGFVVGSAVEKHLNSRRHAPRGVGELSDRVLDHYPKWVVYPASGKGLGDGLMICNRPRNLDERARLRRAEDALVEWEGYVVVLPDSPGHISGCVRVGNMLLFGDPNMISEIQALCR